MEGTSRVVYSCVRRRRGNRLINAADDFDLRVLDPEANIGYLPQPIPSSRDADIRALLSQVLDGGSLARFSQCLHEPEAHVLSAFGERMATLAVRTRDPRTLHVGLIAFLLSPKDDPRESWIVFPVFCDALDRLGIDSVSFISALRRTIGDHLAMPFLKFLKRPKDKRSLQSMGYIAGADADGFRYVRTW